MKIKQKERPHRPGMIALKLKQELLATGSLAEMCALAQREIKDPDCRQTLCFAAGISVYDTLAAEGGKEKQRFLAKLCALAGENSFYCLMCYSRAAELWMEEGRGELIPGILSLAEGLMAQEAIQGCPALCQEMARLWELCALAASGEERALCLNRALELLRPAARVLPAASGWISALEIKLAEVEAL
ncbi:MAG: hypothetical protein Q4C55_03950 [Eubacterium sp.]|nr:hypothetical protein [Eubacterium sp.]